MYDAKTKATTQSVTEFINALDDEQRRMDCRALVKLMEDITREKAKMWGPSIVGFGSYHYKYASGHEGDSMITGFSPRKQNITLYIMSGFDKQEDLLDKLGKFKTAKSCLYIKKLADVDHSVLKKLIERSVKTVPGRTH